MPFSFNLLVTFLLLPYSCCDVHNTHESESRSVVSDSLRPYGLHSPWNSPGQNIGVETVDLPNPGVKPRSPTLQPDSLPVEPQGREGYL